MNDKRDLELKIAWLENIALSRGEENERLRVRLARAEDECKVWMNAVADAVEPLGYCREAACGPADLLPGLATLVELAGQS
jgi:hypothetical protein